MLFYLKLLIRDNSNTKLIKEYLFFLKTNPQFETLNLDYQKELQYYIYKKRYMNYKLKLFY